MDTWKLQDENIMELITHIKWLTDGKISLNQPTIICEITLLN
jgi:hypothetical protein